MDSRGRRVKLQELLVFRNRALEIASLLPLNCVLNQFLGGLRPCDRANDENQDEGEFPHTGMCIPIQYTRKKWDGRSHPILVRNVFVPFRSRTSLQVPKRELPACPSPYRSSNWFG